MSKQVKRSGRKLGGKHTTYIPAAAIAADIAVACDAVTNVVPGVIKVSKGKSGSRRNVKIIDVDGGMILLAVTDGAIHQEVRVCVCDKQQAKLCIAQAVRNEGLTISFGSRVTE